MARSRGLPRIQGADVCGYVAATGAGVDPERLGRRVLVDPVLRYSDGPEPLVAEVLGSEADGGYAEQLLVRADRAHDVTGSPLTDVELACLPISSGTAIGMLERAAVHTGETVLVTGASGGVGLALVSLAAGRGARRDRAVLGGQGRRRPGCRSGRRARPPGR